MLGMYAIPAHAQTKAQLQQQVDSLLQQLQNLQAQVNASGGETASAHAGCAAEFRNNFSVGDTGSDVKQLQRFLNAESGVTVAVSGPGSAGNETDFYGSKTAAAVRAFQNKHSADVLAPVGLTSGTGYWGPSSRKHANMICNTNLDGETKDSENESGSTDETAEDESQSSQTPVLEGSPEAFINNYELTGTPSNETLSESETNLVLGAEFDVEDGDVMLHRVDPVVEALDMSGNNNEPRVTKPWTVFQAVSLYYGEKKLGTVSADQERFWSDEGDNPQIDGNDGTEEYATRFSKLDMKLEEGKDYTFYFELTAQENLDSADLPQDFSAGFPQESFRFSNRAGVDIYAGEYLNYQNFTVEPSEAGELTFRTSANEMDERVVEVDDSNDTNDVDLLNFEMEADNQDILVEDFAASTTVNFGGANGSEVSDVVSTLYLSHDGDVITSENVASNSSTTVETTFDNVDIELEEDEEAEFTISGDIDDTNSQSRYVDGTTIDVSVGDTGYGTFNAEETTGSEDDISSVQNNSAVSAEVAHLYEVAPQFTLESTSVTNASSDDDGNGNDTKATFNIEFSVEADDENDVYVPFYDSDNDASIVASTTDGNGTPLTPQASSTKTITKDASSDSSVSQDTDSWRVPSGNTGVFTFQLKANNDDNNDKNFSDRFVASKIESLKWSTTTPKDSTSYQDTSTDLNEFDWNLEDWETDPVSLDS